MLIRTLAIMATMLTLAAPVLLPSIAAGADPSAEDWREDAPGRVHRIDVATLPAPYATPSHWIPQAGREICFVINHNVADPDRDNRFHSTFSET